LLDKVVEALHSGPGFRLAVSRTEHRMLGWLRWGTTSSQQYLNASSCCFEKWAGASHSNTKPCKCLQINTSWTEKTKKHLITQTLQLH